MAPVPACSPEPSQNDLVALVRSRGVTLTAERDGRYVGGCPFCHAPAGALIVAPDEARFWCAGCGRGGDCAAFIQQFDGLSRRHAAEILKAGALAYRACHEGPRHRTTVPRLPSPLHADSGHADLLAEVAGYYHERLLATPALGARLAGLGLGAPDLLARFRLGWADRTLGLRLPARNRHAGAALRQRLQEVGVLRASGHEHLGGCLTVPVPDGPSAGGEPARDDGLIGLYGQRIAPDRSSARCPVVRLSRPGLAVWNAEALAGTDLVLCATPLDALTFWANGVRNVTFVPDAEAAALLEAVVRQGVRRVWLAYPAMAAASAPAAMAALRLGAAGVACRRVRLPWGWDVCHYARCAQAAAPTLRKLLAEAFWLAPAPTPRQPRCGPRPPATPACAPCPPSPLRLEPGGAAYGARFEDRAYRIGGLECAPRLAALRATVRLVVDVAPDDPASTAEEDRPLAAVGTASVRAFVDRLDLARDRQRQRFVTRAAQETGCPRELLHADVGRILLALELARDRGEPPFQSIARAAPSAAGARPDACAKTARARRSNTRPVARPAAPADPPMPGLPPRTAAVLDVIRGLHAAACADASAARSPASFTRRELQDRLNCGDTQLRVHLRRLCRAGWLSRCPSWRGTASVYERLDARAPPDRAGVRGTARGSAGGAAGALNQAYVVE